MTMTTPDDRRLSKTRPLPDPGGSQPSSPASVRSTRPNLEPGTASASNTSEPIAPTSFYGKTAQSRDPPPLPVRPSIPPSSAEGLGSKSTVYIPPESDPTPSSPFRSPVLVPDSPPAQPTPPLLRPVTDSDWSNNKSGLSQWTENWTVAPNDVNASWMKDTDEWRTAEAAKWTSTWGRPSYGFKINGRDEAEEQVWWDSMARDAFGRPGPGILPTCAIDFIMQKSDTLYSVQGHLPNAEELTRGHQPAQPVTDAPTEDEVHMALPHPDAFFSTKEFGWMVILWRESSQPPPIFPRAYLPSPLPDAERRKATKPCGPDGENLTHHFHSISDIIDASKIDPPYLRAPWQDQPEKPEDFNALMCCQCPLWGVFSYTLPSVIPKEVMEALVQERAQSPSPGQSPFDAVYTAITTIHIVIQNRLWKAEERKLPVDATSALFRKIGWTPHVNRVFESLGFSLGTQNERPALVPPSINPATPEGKLNRSRLLRAHLEVGAWLQDYKKRNAMKLSPDQKHVITIGIDDHLSDLQLRIGADPISMPRDVPSFVHHWGPSVRLELGDLGVTIPSATYEAMGFAYMAQQRCHPSVTSDMFTLIVQYATAAQQYGEQIPEWFQQLIIDERDRGRFTQEDIDRASQILGFGENGPLGVSLDDVDALFLVNAVEHALQTAAAKGLSARDIGDAFRIVAHTSGNRAIVETYERLAERGWMSVDDAYRTLGASKEVDDAMLIMAAQMQMVDAPAQADKVKEAIAFIAQARDSFRLRKFLEIGEDPGDVLAPVRADLPRGLNQLGNTCYLNSLLQYFYTIKDLREAVLELSQTDPKSFDDGDAKLTEDNLKKVRVGGRNVTRREIARSRRFVKHLGDLFFNLEYAENPAVTPELELAKLALVTSKDEEEDEADRPQTDGSRGSADTDATLVEDAPMSVSSPRANTPLSPGSVLGKRTRGEGGSKTSDGDVEMVQASVEPSQAPPTVPKRKATQTVNSGMMFGRQHDVAECMDNCMFQIETALLRFDELAGSDSDKTSVVKRLFFGKLRQRISAPTSPRRSKSSLHEKEDLFSHLPVQVSDEGYDLYDGLSAYFDDTVEFEGRQARMEVSLIDLPPILQIQLQRVLFDRDTMQAYKSNAYVKFDETIHMDRFLDRADPDKKARAQVIQAELNTCRERIQILTKGKHAPAAPALAHVADFLSKYDGMQFEPVDSELIAQLGEEQNVLADELARLRNQSSTLKKELEEVWAGSAEVEYELTSVFIHREYPDKWFKYNDAQVTEVPKEEVFADTTGQTANPYLLVYARKGSQIMDTVKRFDPATLEEAEV